MSRARTSKGCPQEVRVLAAIRTGQWDEALEAHTAGCPACGEVALVSGTLRTFARKAEGRNRLPDPYLVWLKAQLTERQVTSHRKSKPWYVAEALGQGVAAVTLGGWLVVELTLFNQRLSEWVPGRWLDDWLSVWSLMTFAVGVPPSWVLWTLIGVMCFVVLMVAEPLFAER